MDHAEIIETIEQATYHRGWISNSYAQVEFLLGDLIMRCRQFPEYAEFTATISHSAPKRVSKVRSMLSLEGPLVPYRPAVTAVLDAFEGNHEVRNLLAHGFCEFHHTPTGDAGLVFRKFERGGESASDQGDTLITRTFRLVDMHYHREQSVAQAQQALELFARIHSDLGWI